MRAVFNLVNECPTKVLQPIPVGTGCRESLLGLLQALAVDPQFQGSVENIARRIAFLDLIRETSAAFDAEDEAERDALRVTFERCNFDRTSLLADSDYKQLWEQEVAIWKEFARRHAANSSFWEREALALSKLQRLADNETSALKHLQDDVADQRRRAAAQPEPGQWECCYCTFHNSKFLTICEMCSNAPRTPAQ